MLPAKVPSPRSWPVVVSKKSTLPAGAAAAALRGDGGREGDRRAIGHRSLRGAEGGCGRDGYRGEHQVVAVAAGVVGLEPVGRPAVRCRDRSALRQVGKGAGDRMAGRRRGGVVDDRQLRADGGAKLSVRRQGQAGGVEALGGQRHAGSVQRRDDAAGARRQGDRAAVAVQPGSAAGVVEDDLSRAGWGLDDHRRCARRWWPAWRW